MSGFGGRDRMKLHGKKIKQTRAGNTPVWEAEEVLNDFGACQP
jgi:hypothetical protein